MFILLYSYFSSVSLNSDLVAKNENNDDDDDNNNNNNNNSNNNDDYSCWNISWTQGVAQTMIEQRLEDGAREGKDGCRITINSKDGLQEYVETQ